MVSLKRLCVLSLPSSLRISEKDSWWNISCILNFCGSFIKNNSRIPISEIVISILTAQEKLCKTAFSCELMFMLLHCILFTILTQFFIAFFWANMVNGTSPSSNKTPIFVVCFCFRICWACTETCRLLCNQPKNLLKEQKHFLATNTTTPWSIWLESHH